MNNYTKQVGYKFNPDGSLMHFPGATIVSHLEKDSPLFTQVLAFQNSAQQLPYSNKFSFLSPSSFHMTNYVLYNDNELDRNSEGWSNKYPNDTPKEQMDKNIYEDIKHIHFPKSFCMTLTHIHNNSLRLAPADDKTAHDLKAFRDAVADATGIRWPDHDSYVFHISYAYYLILLTPEEKQHNEIFLAEQALIFQKKFPTFIIPQGEFCTFEDMGHFEPYTEK